MPYNSRHSYISWRLMLGHNRLLVALEDGHSVTTMEKTYAAWIQGTKTDDLEMIKAAMAGRSANHGDEVDPADAAGTRSPWNPQKLALGWH